MSFELGVYSFGNTPGGSTAQAVRNVLEAVRVAEEVGLDFFGFGEHHTGSMPLSSPTALTDAIRRSTLDWTIARITSPNDKPAKGRIRAGFLGRDKVGAAMTRADIAASLVGQLADHTYLQAAPAISN